MSDAAIHGSGEFDLTWSAVAGLKPRLKPHVEIARHQYRGEGSYLLRDALSGRVHRLLDGAYDIVGALDGRRSVEEIFVQVAERRTDAGPSRGDVADLIMRLDGMGLLRTGRPPNAEKIQRRQASQRRSVVLAHLKSPLYLRIPLWDPTRFLDVTEPLWRHVFSRWFCALYLSALCAGAFLAVMKWSVLARDFDDQLLTAENLFMVWMLYPAVKFIHEMAHAITIRRFGGAVREIGIMFIAFIPMPYVDASGAAMLPDKRRRALVAAAGVLAEGMIGALAIIAWAQAEPSLLRVALYNVMLICGVSTLFFNANPLQRFDGYYMLSDMIEIPNLATRSVAQYGYLAKRFILGDREAQAPQRKPGELAWFIFYAPASYLYRTTVLVLMVLTVAGSYFELGVLLAIWTAIGAFALPLVKAMKNTTRSPGLRQRPWRAALGAGVAGLTVAALVFAIPAPHATVAQGVLMLPETIELRTEVAGFVDEVLVPAGSWVRAGQPVLRLDNETVRTRAAILEARERELDLVYRAELPVSQVSAAITLERLVHARGALAQVRADLAALEVRAHHDGRFLLPSDKDMAGSFLRRGASAGLVVPDKSAIVRAVVPAADADLVRGSTRQVGLRFADRADRIVEGRLIREVPGASDRLPSPVLSLDGGGAFAVVPDSGGTSRTREPVFIFDIGLPEAADMTNLGGRVYVRFDHGGEPVGFQVWRSIRQTFLGRFHL
ncbi:putative peptide zinc metalloprotease protein [Skermanella aerolata]|uniref:hypothetical protein n=1 Tax=Skermanella aerolata TaxID=393310 RepID=UPI003D24C8FE